ncbi:MAG: O-antigen ligase family protein, partial [Egibacteraceae bacterium]
PGHMLGDRVTVAGLGLLVALLLWIQVSAMVSGGRSAALNLLVATTGITFAGARRITRGHSWAVPAAVMTGAAGVLLVAGDVFGNYGSPLGYANATGAFCVLGAAAALMVAVRRPGGLARAVALPAIAGFATVAVFGGSKAAAASIVLVGLAWPAQRGDGTVRTTILAGAALAVFALVASTTVGALSLGSRGTTSIGDRLIDETLSVNRVVLWHEALSMLRARPLAGVGPGRFAELSPTALRDGDLRWAHHEFLELGAETGGVGLMLGVALAAWVFIRLWHGERDAGTAVAALAIAALLSHTTVDYVLHFPPVTLAAAALAGAGAPPVRPSRPVGRSARRSGGGAVHREAGVDATLPVDALRPDEVRNGLAQNPEVE